MTVGFVNYPPLPLPARPPPQARHPADLVDLSVDVPGLSFGHPVAHLSGSRSIVN